MVTISLTYSLSWYGILNAFLLVSSLIFCVRPRIEWILFGYLLSRSLGFSLLPRLLQSCNYSLLCVAVFSQFLSWFRKSDSTHNFVQRRIMIQWLIPRKFFICVLSATFTSSIHIIKRLVAICGSFFLYNFSFQDNVFITSENINFTLKRVAQNLMLINFMGPPLQCAQNKNFFVISGCRYLMNSLTPYRQEFRSMAESRIWAYHIQIYIIWTNIHSLSTILGKNLNWFCFNECFHLFLLLDVFLCLCG